MVGVFPHSLVYGVGECKMKQNLAMDSGAFSLFNKYGKKGAIEHSDFSFYKTQKFFDYLSTYIGWLQQGNREGLQFYVTVDVIFNPEMSWEIWNTLLDAGLKPLPVIHYGEDLKWVKKYADLTDHIGLGGMGSRQSSVEQYIKWVDAVFKLFGARPHSLGMIERGKPTHKIHGFALTQYDVLNRYPWHSVDSTTCWRAASNGSFIIPQSQVVGKKTVFDYTGRPFWFPCTEGRRDNAANVWKMGPTYRRVVDKYLEQFGYTMEQTKENYVVRNVVSFYYFYQLSKVLTERRDYPFLFYSSGRPAGTSDVVLRDLLKDIARIGCDEFNYLGTFFDPKTFGIFKRYLEEDHADKKPDASSPSSRPGTSRPRLRPHLNPLLLRKRPRVRIR